MPMPDKDLVVHANYRVPSDKVIAQTIDDAFEFTIDRAVKEHGNWVRDEVTKVRVDLSDMVRESMKDTLEQAAQPGARIPGETLVQFSNRTGALDTAFVKRFDKINFNLEDFDTRVAAENAVLTSRPAAFADVITEGVTELDLEHQYKQGVPASAVIPHRNDLSKGQYLNFGGAQGEVADLARTSVPGLDKLPPEVVDYMDKGMIGTGSRSLKDAAGRAASTMHLMSRPVAAQMAGHETTHAIDSATKKHSKARRLSGSSERRAHIGGIRALQGLGLGKEIGQDRGLLALRDYAEAVEKDPTHLYRKQRMAHAKMSKAIFGGGGKMLLGGMILPLVGAAVAKVIGGAAGKMSA